VSPLVALHAPLASDQEVVVGMVPGG
jgi:hypothetical protein